MSNIQQVLTKVQRYGELRQKYPAVSKAELLKKAISEIEEEAQAA